MDNHTIARAGNFALRRKVYLGKHEYTTHEIELVKYDSKGHCYTIATWDDEHQVTSCGSRLFQNIGSQEELLNLSKLVQIGELILNDSEDYSLGEKESKFTLVKEENLDD